MASGLVLEEALAAAMGMDERRAGGGDEADEAGLGQPHGKGADAEDVGRVADGDRGAAGLPRLARDDVDGLERRHLANAAAAVDQRCPRRLAGDDRGCGAIDQPALQAVHGVVEIVHPLGTDAVQIGLDEKLRRDGGMAGIGAGRNHEVARQPFEGAGFDPDGRAFGHGHAPSG